LVLPATDISALRGGDKNHETFYFDSYLSIEALEGTQDVQ